MPWRRAGSGSVILLAIGALVTAASLGYEFYAPVVGQIANGSAAQAKPDVPRDRAIVKAAAYMSPKPWQALPSLADVIRFYGLEQDTIPCAVQANHGEAASAAAIPVLASRPLQPEEEVILCLD
jgi:hypothetical protein